jgi:hypothetical protein
LGLFEEGVYGALQRKLHIKVNEEQLFTLDEVI